MLTGCGAVRRGRKIRDCHFSDLPVRRKDYCQIITKNSGLLQSENYCHHSNNWNCTCYNRQ
ncbi:hypothetical protein D3G46_22965 [Escherichia coli]|nr:hypothetical protein [Escherichia coli]EFN9703507.1 hypothetical protein [Escherichia coli]